MSEAQRRSQKPGCGDSVGVGEAGHRPVDDQVPVTSEGHRKDHTLGDLARATLLAMALALTKAKKDVDEEEGVFLTGC